MPDLKQTIVTNTTPLIALAAGLGSLDILRALYNRVMVPWEVNEEIHAAGQDAPGVLAFDQASWLECQSEPVAIAPYLRNTLDRGEASVIQTALDLNIPLAGLYRRKRRPASCASIRTHPDRFNRHIDQGQAAGLPGVHS